MPLKVQSLASYLEAVVDTLPTTDVCHRKNYVGLDVKFNHYTVCGVAL
jgi:hypothetical protein